MVLTKRLTDDVEVYEVRHVRCCRDLTLVDPLVPVLGVLDLEGPVLAALMVDRSEPLVRGVGVPTHCQEVDVTVSHPRHLQHIREGRQYLDLHTSSQTSV